MTRRLSVALQAVKQFAKLDKATAKIITLWLRKNIEGCENPRVHGKPLKDEPSGSWRYRIGNYRVLCEIRDSELVVLAFETARRSEAYAKKTAGRKRK